MTDSEESKIFTRSRILKELAKFNENGKTSNSELESAISNLSQIQDKIMLTKTVLREMNGKNGDYDSILGIILANCATREGEEFIFQALRSKDVKDSVKICLIGALREINSNLNYGDLLQYIDNIDDLTDYETQKFIENAKISPEAQIDFLDFFFAVNLDDKIELLNSLSNGFQNDELVNILTLLIYQTKDLEVVQKCVEMLEKTNLMIAYIPLNYVLENCEDEKIKNLAMCALKKIKNTKEADCKCRVEMFTNSKPYCANVCLLDGQSNFVLFFAREKNDKTYQAFSAVLNLKNGIIACFGFDDISYKEFQTFHKKIFYENAAIKIPFEIAAKIENEIFEYAVKNKKQIPYEFYVWRQLMFDIEPSDKSMEEQFSACLEKVEVSEFEFKNFQKSEFLQKWFMRYNENKAFNGLILNILNLKTFSAIKNAIIEAKDDVFNEFPIDLMLKYQAYFLHLKNDKFANILYSITYDKNFKDDFLLNILKKSVYEYFANEYNIVENDNIFSNRNLDTLNIKRVYNLIKDKW